MFTNTISQSGLEPTSWRQKMWKHKMFYLFFFVLVYFSQAFGSQTAREWLMPTMDESTARLLIGLPRAIIIGLLIVYPFRTWTKLLIGSLVILLIEFPFHWFFQGSTQAYAVLGLPMVLGMVLGQFFLYFLLLRIEAKNSKVLLTTLLLLFIFMQGAGTLFYSNARSTLLQAQTLQSKIFSGELTSYEEIVRQCSALEGKIANPCPYADIALKLKDPRYCSIGYNPSVAYQTINACAFKVLVTPVEREQYCRQLTDPTHRSYCYSALNKK